MAGLLGELSEESASLIRRELRLIGADLLAQGRRVGGSAALLGGAGLLGVGSFGALTAALIALLGRRPARGPLIVAALYGAGAGALAEAAITRLGDVAPEAAKTLRRDLKALALGAPSDEPAEELESKPAKQLKSSKPTKSKRKPAAKPSKRFDRS